MGWIYSQWIGDFMRSLYFSFYCVSEFNSNPQAVLHSNTPEISFPSQKYPNGISFRACHWHIVFELLVFLQKYIKSPIKCGYHLSGFLKIHARLPWELSKLLFWTSNTTSNAGSFTSWHIFGSRKMPSFTLYYLFHGFFLSRI